MLIALATLIWVPVGVWIGLRPKLAERVQPLAQFLAAFPANLAFPVFVVVIVRYGLNPNIWLSPLMILGTQWYILFNVIAGASAFPADLREAAGSFHLRGWRWWIKVILPGIFPYYVTGAITASGGSWNASIVAEVASWGDTHLTATGLGAYIATRDGSRRLPPGRSRHRRDVHSGDAFQPAALEAALCLRRASSSPRLIRRKPCSINPTRPICSISAVSAGPFRRAAAKTCWCSKKSI